MEKFPNFERVVGKISKEEKVEILERKAKDFNDSYFKELEGKEREKTPEELEIIDLVNQATNEVLYEYGGEVSDIPAENIHIILEEMWPDSKKSTFYSSLNQAVAFKEPSVRIVFLTQLFHEILHFKSYKALQAITPEEGSSYVEVYRGGLEVISRDDNYRYFEVFNEALTEELTKRFVTKLFDHPLFAEDRLQTTNIANKYPKAVTKEKTPLFNEETYYAEVVNEYLNTESKKVANIEVSSFGYESEREILSILVNKLYEKNLDSFKCEEEVFRLFAEGMFSGNLLTTGKLIEKTFGDGTFRKLGELGSDPEGQRGFIESLG
jgi:hypothetical protein